MSAFNSVGATTELKSFDKKIEKQKYVSKSNNASKLPITTKSAKNASNIDPNRRSGSYDLTSIKEKKIIGGTNKKNVVRNMSNVHESANSTGTKK